MPPKQTLRSTGRNFWPKDEASFEGHSVNRRQAFEVSHGCVIVWQTYFAGWIERETSRNPYMGLSFSKIKHVFQELQGSLCVRTMPALPKASILFQASRHEDWSKLWWAGSMCSEGLYSLDFPPKPGVSPIFPDSLRACNVDRARHALFGVH